MPLGVMLAVQEIYGGQSMDLFRISVFGFRISNKPEYSPSNKCQVIET